MEEIYVGKRVYYINRYYKAVFAKIVEINGDEVIVKSEYGKKIVTEKKAIINNKVTYEKPIEVSYAQCQCGNTRFYRDEDTLVCTNCSIPYNRDELNLLGKTDKLESIEKEENRIIN